MNIAFLRIYYSSSAYSVRTYVATDSTGTLLLYRDLLDVLFC